MLKEQVATIGQTPEIRLSSEVQERFLARAEASGIESRYWRPEYVLAIKAAEVLRKVFPEHDRSERALRSLNRALRVYEVHKPRDSGVGYWTHIVDAALRNQDVQIEFALESVDSESRLLQILNCVVDVNPVERLPIECTEADLAHDDLEDLGYSVEQLAEELNPRTARMVAIMSKLSTAHFRGLSKEELEHRLFSLQYFSLASLMEGLIGKLRGDWRSNAATLKYKKGKNGISDEQARGNTSRGYLDRFGGIILEGQLEETHEALDECMTFGYPLESQRYAKMRARMAIDMEEAIDQVGGFLNQFDTSRVVKHRCSRPSTYHMYVRERKDRTADPRILCSPTFYVECTSASAVDDMKTTLEHMDFKRGTYDQGFIGRSSRLTTHDNSEVWVFRRDGVTVRFVMYTPDKAYLYEPMKNLIMEFRSPRQQEMREQLERVSRLYQEQFDDGLPAEVLSQIIQGEMGRRRILVGFNGDREVLLPAGGAVLDAYARIARVGGWDYENVPTGFVVRYRDGAREGVGNMYLGLYEGEHVDVSFDGECRILPDMHSYGILRTFEARFVMYKAAASICRYYRSRRARPLMYSESRDVMRAFESSYGQSVRTLLN